MEPRHQVGKVERRETIQAEPYYPDAPARAQALLTALPEGVEIATQPTPMDSRGALYSEKDPLYQIFKPGEVDPALLQLVLDKYKLKPDTPVLMLPYGERGSIGYETRRLYFDLAVGPDGRMVDGVQLDSTKTTADAPITRIISFGDCNVACGYCKRDCQFIDDKGKPIISMPVPLIDIARLCEGAQSRSEIVRFSGGDPVVFPQVTLAIAEYLFQRYGVKSSIAHNGTGPQWVKKLAPYLSSAAIDLKGVPTAMGSIMGVSDRQGELYYSKSLETQRVLSTAGVLLDVRTPVFGNTSLDDMMRLAQAISATNDLEKTFWTWRMYKPVKGCDWPVPEKTAVMEMMQQVSESCPDLWMGIRAKWEKGGMTYLKAGAVRTQSVDTTVPSPEFGSGNKINL